MSAKTVRYTAEFKTKVILELLSGDLTLAEVCSKHGVTSKSIIEWKKIFLLNASLAFNIDGAVSGYQKTIAEKEKEVNELHRQLGKRTAELEWVSKKLKSLGFEIKKQMIKSELNTENEVSVSRRCELLSFNRSSFYYQESEGPVDKRKLFQAIDEIYSESPFYGYRKI